MYSYLHYVENGIEVSFEPGEYWAMIQSTNSNAWTDDGSTWRYANSSLYYFEVAEEENGWYTNKYDGHEYLIVDNATSWHDAKERCERMGGHLATITSEAEFNAIVGFVDLVDIKDAYFVGGTDEKFEGVWEWVTGEEWSYNGLWNWGEPNNTEGIEHYMHVYKKANDVPSYAIHGFICELEDNCGNNLDWKFVGEAECLEISGSGAMYDFTEGKNAPWYVYASGIKSVSIGKGITLIDRDAFAECVDLTDIYFDGGKAEWNSILKEGNNTYFDNATIHFAEEDVWVEGITMDSTFVSLLPDETITITASVLPDNATNKNVVWTTSDEKVAIVDENGVVKAVGVGKATITVITEDIGFSASCEVLVDKPITSTKYKTLTSTYKFYIECERALNDEMLVVACYDETGRTIALKAVECDGDNTYTASVPKDTNIKYAKVFLWNDYDGMKPINRAEPVEVN